VREAGAADAAALARIQVAAWRAAYAGLLPDDVLAGLSVAGIEAQWATRIPAVAPVSCLVTGTPPVGFVGAGPAWDDAGTGQVYVIYVDPAHWGRGLGRQLLRAAVLHLRSVGFATATLWVLTTNTRARGFYEHEGWSPTGRTRVERLYDADVPETEYERSLPG
jgi:ribosomal protein S18 acetylase RimI-like enzyme